MAAIARALKMDARQAAAFVRAHGIPLQDIGGKVLVDAGVCERVVRRELGESAARAIHAERDRGDEPRRARDNVVREGPPPSSPQSGDETVEEMLIEAIRAHGGVLSYPLYRDWAHQTGRKPLDPGTICRALDAPTWTAALNYCGGRRGVTTLEDRAEAHRLLARALEDLGGSLRMKDYHDWAIAHEARWRDPVKVARAAGFPTWSAAIRGVSGENAANPPA
jgi:hypothetical protein